MRGWGGLPLDRRNDETRSRRWLAVLAACCLVFQALSSGLALGACASPDRAEEPLTVSDVVEPSEQSPDGSDSHHHRGAPDCCFFACHLLTGKIAPSSAEIVLARAEPAPAGLTGPEERRRGDPGNERLPQNPRAPPLPA
jgi:hypothetical protein